MAATNFELLYNVTKRILVEFGFDPARWSSLLRSPLSGSISIAADEGRYVMDKIMDKSLVDSDTSILSTYKLTFAGPARQDNELALDVISETEDRRSSWISMHLPRVLSVRPLTELEVEQYDFLVELISNNLDLADNTNNTQYFISVLDSRGLL